MGQTTRLVSEIRDLLAKNKLIPPTGMDSRNGILRAYMQWACGQELPAGIITHHNDNNYFVLDEQTFKVLYAYEPKKETPVAEKAAATATTPNPMSKLLDSVKTGAHLALANEAGELSLEAIGAMFPQLQPLLKDDLGRSLGKAAGATLLAYLAEVTNLPEKENVSKVCGLVMTASTQEVASEKLAALRPVLMKLAALGKSLPSVINTTAEEAK